MSIKVIISCDSYGCDNQLEFEDTNDTVSVLSNHEWYESIEAFHYCKKYSYEAMKEDHQ